MGGVKIRAKLRRVKMLVPKPQKMGIRKYNGNLF